MGQTAAMPPRFAVILQVCEHDQALAQAALESYRLSTPGLETHYFIMDDASPNRVGEQLQEELEDLGLPVTLTTLSRPHGYHGLALRFAKILENVYASGVRFDAIVKFDSDTLFTSPRFSDTLKEFIRLRGPAIAGVRGKLRFRDRILLTMDLLPFGFRRQIVDDQIIHRWGPRPRPTAISRVLRQALKRGYRYTYVNGAMSIYNMALIDEMARRKWLPDSLEAIGLMFTDDLTPAVAAIACDAHFYDLDRDGANWLSPHAVVNDVDEHDWMFVHPVKMTPRNCELRAEILGRLRRSGFVPAPSTSPDPLKMPLPPRPLPFNVAGMATRA